MNSNSDSVKTKKIVYSIKYKNIKEATVNNSALVGLKRVNKMLML